MSYRATARTPHLAFEPRPIAPNDQYGWKAGIRNVRVGAFDPLYDGRDPAMEESTLNMQFAPGDLYEDCAYHPCLCGGVDVADDVIWGISLIDGSYPRSCSLAHCGVRNLGVDEAWEIKQRHIRCNGQDGWWEAAQPE